MPMVRPEDGEYLKNGKTVSFLELSPEEQEALKPHEGSKRTSFSKLKNMFQNEKFSGPESLKHLFKNLSWQEKEFILEAQAAAADSNFWIILNSMRDEGNRRLILGTPELKKAWLDACQEAIKHYPPRYRFWGYKVKMFFINIFCGDKRKEDLKKDQAEYEAMVRAINESIYSKTKQKDLV